MSSSVSLLQVSDPGWRNMVHLPIGDLACGWRLNGNGRLSVRVPARHLYRLNWTDIKGRWVFVPLPWVGVWAGYIEDVSTDIGTGIAELSATTMGGHFGKRRTPRSYRQTSSSPGALAQRAVTDTGLDYPLWITEFEVDEDGAPVTVEWRGDKLDRVISSLANGAGAWWDVVTSLDRIMTLRFRAMPRDRRGTVLLAEGFNVLSGTVRSTISQLVNDMLGIANDSDWQKSAGSVVEDADSIQLYERSQETQRFSGHTRKSSLEAVTRLEVTKRSVPFATVSFDIAATNPILGAFEQGDLVRFWSAGQNQRYDLTVTGRAYDSRGTVTIVGTGVPA